MDDDLWDASQLGRISRTDRGPRRRAQRIRARAHVGRRLREWRTRQGLSQTAAHEQLGLAGPASRGNQLEVGEVPWSKADVAAVAAAVGLDPDNLVREAIAVDDAGWRARRARFVAWARTLERHEWQAVVDEVERPR